MISLVDGVDCDSRYAMRSSTAAFGMIGFDLPFTGNLVEPRKGLILRIDDLDTGGSKRRKQIVEILG